MGSSTPSCTPVTRGAGAVCSGRVLSDVEYVMGASDVHCSPQEAGAPEHAANVPTRTRSRSPLTFLMKNVSPSRSRSP
eukprot:6218972-Prymnesium_polylepis.2